MKLRTLSVAVLGAVGLAALPACKKDEASPSPAPVSRTPVQDKAAPMAEAPAAAPAPQPLTGGGTVRGTVTFKGVAPTPAAIAPSDDPACQGMALADPSLQVKDGKVENVLVRVRGLMPRAQSAQPAVIDQSKCMYTPRVQGVAAGQPVLIKNSDGTLHNARALAGTKSIFNVAQPPNGKAVQRSLPGDAEVVRLKCDIHPWMTAWVVVNPNPFFATSGADGAFSIEHLPAGTYTLEAWHERLGTRTAEVTVKEGETTSASFEFSAEDAKGSAAGNVK
ncbi:carboxypeptidase regulatory-like domain-containing protein [Vitiosangium sp. GDMCC 1.1324]|uniref:carboxypeptidase regulatory-like domain-containing protein n=1 Tax=Vitiosangium sp. (strain GDMCC 1.1324) TaxID=2138576 RepID=UPI000D3D13B1|nr:carboxypeptidase regulatory-like domain-containing protein [Vitiosangium sp. GDMCC 1.1324]PTL78666.1 TonB-dependent receptor [Vitiosangium sp. GDMCC 1.1324]